MATVYTLDNVENIIAGQENSLDDAKDAIRHAFTAYSNILLEIQDSISSSNMNESDKEEAGYSISEALSAVPKVVDLSETERFTDEALETVLISIFRQDV